MFFYDSHRDSELEARCPLLAWRVVCRETALRLRSGHQAGAGEVIE